MHGGGGVEQPVDPAALRDDTLVGDRGVKDVLLMDATASPVPTNCGDRVIEGPAFGLALAG